MRLEDLLIHHEGLKLKPYLDSVGKLTVGIGRNLKDRGITYEEALVLLDNDILRIRKEVTRFPWFQRLNTARQDVVLCMIFNLGLEGFKRFRKTIAAIKDKDWDRAATEMLDSVWAGQVGNRAIELAEMMKTGIHLELA